MTSQRDQAVLWTVPHLDGLHLLRARFVTHAFKKHAHDDFVIGMVESGLQRFEHGRHRHTTSPNGIIVINPGEAHTGEAAGLEGFQYRALYPEVLTMQNVFKQLSGRGEAMPFFSQPIIYDEALFAQFRALHTGLELFSSPLKAQSDYLLALAALIQRHGKIGGKSTIEKHEKAEITRLRAYLEAHYMNKITLADLANVVFLESVLPAACVSPNSGSAAARLFRDGAGAPSAAASTGRITVGRGLAANWV